MKVYESRKFPAGDTGDCSALERGDLPEERPRILDVNSSRSTMKRYTMIKTE